MLQILIVGAIIGLSYSSFYQSFGLSLISYFFLLVFTFAYHLSQDSPTSNFFLRVILIFIISTGLSILFNYTSNNLQFLTFIAQVLNISGFFLILLVLIKEVNLQLVFIRYTLLTIGIFFINALLIYKIVDLINQYQLGSSHMVYSFIFTIVKTLLLSLGLIGYFMSTRKTKRIVFLGLSFAVFLAGDLIDTINYLFFMGNLVSAWVLVESLSLAAGIFFFYKFCVSPNDEIIMENN